MNYDKIVYLAGPITGLTYKGCTDWRDVAKESLEWEDRPNSFNETLLGGFIGSRREPTGILALSPMRMKKWLDDDRPIPPMASDYDDQFVVERDLYDIRRSDVLLMNLLGAERVSIGSMQEMGYAKAKDKFVVTLIEPEGQIEAPVHAGPTASSGIHNPHHHLFTYQNSSVVMHDLDDAIEVIKGL